MSKFMVVSRQAYELEKDRIELEAKVCDIEKESGCKMGEWIKLEDEVKELKNLAKELRTILWRRHSSRPPT